MGKTGKIIIRILFLFSLGLNIALGIHFLNHPANSRNAGDVENKSAVGSKFDKTALVLSQKQTQDLKQIRTQYMKTYDDLHQKMANYQAELLTLLKADKIDREKLSICLNNINQTNRDLQAQTVEEILDSKKHLSSEQCQCLLDKVGENMQVSNSSKEGKNQAMKCTASCCSSNERRKEKDK